MGNGDVERVLLEQKVGKIARELQGEIGLLEKPGYRVLERQSGAVAARQRGSFVDW